MQIQLQNLSSIELLLLLDTVVMWSRLLKYSYFHFTFQIDTEGANADKVMQELANFGVISESWGGDVPMVKV